MVGHHGRVRPADPTWETAIQRFRDLAGDSDAGRAYVTLLEGARARWESVIAIHPWRLDVLDLRPREPSELAIQAEYRVRDGQPIIILSSATEPG